MNPESVMGNSYIVKFKCTKQGKSRVIEISLAARKAVLDYREDLAKHKQSGSVNDEDKLFHYADPKQFARALKIFLAKNGYECVQSHDFRVSRACEMYVEHGDVEEIRQYF